MMLIKPQNKVQTPLSNIQHPSSSFRLCCHGHHLVNSSVHLLPQISYHSTWLCSDFFSSWNTNVPLLHYFKLLENSPPKLCTPSPCCTSPPLLSSHPAELMSSSSELTRHTAYFSSTKLSPWPSHVPTGPRFSILHLDGILLNISKWILKYILGKMHIYIWYLKPEKKY